MLFDKVHLQMKNYGNNIHILYCNSVSQKNRIEVYTCETHDQEQPRQSKCFAIACMHFPPKKQPFVLL